MNKTKTCKVEKSFVSKKHMRSSLIYNKIEDMVKKCTTHPRSVHIRRVPYMSGTATGNFRSTMPRDKFISGNCGYFGALY